MRWNTLFFGCVALLLTGQAQCNSDECGIKADDQSDDSDDKQIACKRSTSAFLRSLPFTVDNMSVSMDLDKAQCFYPVCCNIAMRDLLRDRRLISYSSTSKIDYEGFIKVGASLDGNFSCRDAGLGIANTTARCDRFEIDGSGWNLVEEDEHETLCISCQRGSYLADNVCKLCPQGEYTEEEGATECEPCPRGTYTEGEGATQCLYCPAGHTTYSYNPNICVGPQLNIYSDRSGKNIAFTARVSYNTLERITGYWSSIGDWRLLNRYNTPFATITQRYTTSYRSRPKVLLKKFVTAVEPIIENVYCYKKGEQYKGYAHRTASGETCTGPHQHCKSTNEGRICYCRNRKANHGDTKPYCETTNGAEEDCDIPKCNGSNENVTPCGYKQYDNISNDPFDTNRIEFGNRKSAQRICDKLGGECGGVWGTGSSWRFTGLSLSEDELGSGPYTFYGKSSDCANPYYEYYFEQNWES